MTLETALDGPVVLVSPVQGEPQIIVDAEEEGGTLSLFLPDGSETEYADADITRNPDTGRLEITTPDGTYLLRELRETDGLWVSKYKTVLPIEALENLAKRMRERAEMNADETLYAYAIDDSPYVVGLGYSDGDDRYSRVDGDWVELEDDTFSNEGIIAIPIDPSRADEYIKLFDENYVTVTDTEDFEAPTQE